MLLPAFLLIGKPGKYNLNNTVNFQKNICGFSELLLRHFLFSFDFNEAGSDPLKARRPA